MIILVFLLLFTRFLLIENSCTINGVRSYEPKHYDDPNYVTVFCGIFWESGCSCREYVNMYATCYDPEHCKKFPKTFKTALTNFKLATTGVRSIIAGDFDNYTNIESLELEANNNLQWIEPGVFRNMSRLKNLSISYNPNMLFFEDNLFEGLVNLEVLSIRRNGFINIKNFSFSLKSKFMPNLRKLELKELYCPIIDKGDFKNLNNSTLEELDLVDSQIEYIHPEALLALKNLRKLSLSENLINTTSLKDVLSNLIKENVPLNTLSLEGFGFKKKLPAEIKEVLAKSNLKSLILSKNQFDMISEDTFPQMPHLEALELSNVLLSNITFSAFFGLPNLKSLCLSKNKFSFIPEAVLLASLQELDLSKNSKLNEAVSYFTMEKYKFLNMSRLERLDLSSNNIRKIPKESFEGLINLKYLNLKECNIFFVDRRSFKSLKQLKFLSLENNPFPSRSFTREIFAGLENLEELELAFCKIRAIPEKTNTFLHLTSLKRLDLRGNGLKVLSPVILQSLQNLEILNVGENHLSVWQERLFHINKQMKVLIAYSNKLTYFSSAMLEDLALLDQVDLSKNPYNCECASFQSLFSFNVSTVKRILYLLNYVPSKCVYPDKYSDYSITQYFSAVNTGEECKPTKWQIIMDYTVPAIILLIILVIVTIVAYLYRWHIRYWIFLTKIFLARRAQFNKNPDLQGHDNYLYDAFVSYSSEDRNFVVRLVAMLENYEPFLKLCVYERDFEIGTIISESVLECVSRSRKTLLVISNSYIKSQWCRWEAQVAENHRLFFENEYGECVNDSIIMIKLGNISQHNLSPMLKYLMKTRIYLQWDSDENKQRQFWEKLRNALAPSSPIPVISKKIESYTNTSKD